METDIQSTRKTVDYEKATHKRESMRANKEQTIRLRFISN